MPLECNFRHSREIPRLDPRGAMFFIMPDYRSDKDWQEGAERFDIAFRYAECIASS